jgi:hypothetical protein
MLQFRIACLRGENVQHQDFEANIGEMAGNTRTHNSGSQYGYFFDSSAHDDCLVS